MFTEFLEANAQNLKSEFYIPLIVNETIHNGKGKVKVLGGGNIWFGVTYKKTKRRYQHAYRSSSTRATIRLSCGRTYIASLRAERCRLYNKPYRYGRI